MNSKCLTYVFVIISLVCFTNFIAINYLVTFQNFNNIFNLTLSDHNVPLTSDALSANSTASTTTTTTTTTAAVEVSKDLVMLFDDPKIYKGPIVLGWPPEQNRSIPNYMESSNPYPVRPSAKLLTDCNILVVVHTRTDGFAARMGIRNSWGKFNEAPNNVSNMSIIYLVGNAKRTSRNRIILYPENQTTLLEESQKYGDLLMVDLVEHYNNLTLKTMHMLKFFNDPENFNGSLPQILIKVDDDIFLNLPLLIKQLSNDPIVVGKTIVKLASKWLIGYRLGDGKDGVAKIPPNKMKLTYAEKWTCPSYMYNGTDYPEVFSGSGYVMSRATAECLYQEGLKLPFFHLEDVFLTGFAAQNCQIQKVHHKGFHHLQKKKINYSRDILIHYVDTASKLDFYNRYNHAKNYHLPIFALFFVCIVIFVFLCSLVKELCSTRYQVNETFS